MLAYSYSLTVSLMFTLKGPYKRKGVGCLLSIKLINSDYVLDVYKTCCVVYTFDVERLANTFFGKVQTSIFTYVFNTYKTTTISRKDLLKLIITLNPIHLTQRDSI